MGALAVYRRASLAIALPVAAIILFQTTYLRAFAEVASERWATRWLGVAIGVVLVWLEWRYVGTLTLLIRARGSVCRLRSLLEDPVEIERRRRRSLRIATISVSAIISLLGAEVIFRGFDIRPPAAPDFIEYRPGRVDDSRNALGIREDWDVIPEDDPRLRIAFLGDSFTYGRSVEPVDTFCHLVESLLSPDWPTGVVTINMGEPGTAPGMQLLTFERLRDALRPDVVVHVVYVNDLGINLQRLLENLYRIRDDRLWVGGTSRVLSFAETQIRYWRIWNDTLGYYRGGLTSEQRAVSWKVFQSDLRACKAAVEETGAVYVLVMFPWLYRLDNYQLKDVHADMGRFATELPVPYLDLLEVFQGRDGDRFRLGGNDDHPNEAGHRLAAERIARFLREDILPSIKR